MELVFYKTSSPANRVSKVLSEPYSINGTLKAPFNHRDFDVTINAFPSSGYNYAAIPSLGIYYLITSIDPRGRGRIKITLHIDVLMTYADVLAGEVAVVSTGGNVYYPDAYSPGDVRIRREVLMFPNSLPSTGTTVMISVRGVPNA